MKLEKTFRVKCFALVNNSRFFSSQYFFVKQGVNSHLGFPQSADNIKDAAKSFYPRFCKLYPVSYAF